MNYDFASSQQQNIVSLLFWFKLLPSERWELPMDTWAPASVDRNGEAEHVPQIVGGQVKLNQGWGCQSVLLSSHVFHLNKTAEVGGLILVWRIYRFVRDRLSIDLLSTFVKYSDFARLSNVAELLSFVNLDFGSEVESLHEFGYVFDQSLCDLWIFIVLHRNNRNGVSLFANYCSSIAAELVEILAWFRLFKQPHSFFLLWQRGEELFRVIFVHLEVLFHEKALASKSSVGLFDLLGCWEGGCTLSFTLHIYVKIFIIIIWGKRAF